METSDHVPCVISISTQSPTRFIFNFENYWMEHADFMPLVEFIQTTPTPQMDIAKILTAKFKQLRKDLKQWKGSLSNVRTNINNVKLVLLSLQFLQEFRDLLLIEQNFKAILEAKLVTLLNQQHIYQKQRGFIKRVKYFGGTKFFHANANIKFWHNLTKTLEDDNGVSIFDHQPKAELIWAAFKERLGVSSF